MASILTRGLRKVAAEAIFTSIVTKTARYYYYFGQTKDFEAGLEEPSSSRAYEGSIRNNIFALKEVLPSDVCFVIERKDWTTGTTYPAYDSHTESADIPYVFNESNFSVYVCVKAGPSTSTVMPTHLTVGAVTESDGYSWKYIYTAPLAQRDKFMTAEWLPVSNTLNEAFFTNGGIASVAILDGGEGYTQDTTSLFVMGDQNIGAGAALRPIVTNGKITSVVIDQPGSGYLSPKITVSSPLATRQAILSPIYASSDVRSSQALIQSLTTPGTVESVKIVAGGTGYTANTTMTIQGDGSGATVSFVRNTTTGVIESVTVTNPGRDYTVASLVIDDLDFVGGTGFDADVNLSPILGFGRDAVRDLGARSIMIYNNISRERLNGLPISNSIRQYGIIVGPKSTESATYPRDRVSQGNYMSKMPLALAAQITTGTIIYNEFPTTGSTQSYRVEEVITSNTEAAIRVRALGDWKFSSGVSYFKDADYSFVSDFNLVNFDLDTQLVSACYVLETTSPDLFNTTVFAPGVSVFSAGNEYVIVASTTTKILLISVDGGALSTGDTLTDSGVNTLSPETITAPVLDKDTGEIITVENRAPFSQNQTQSVSFRTIIKF